MISVTLFDISLCDSNTCPVTCPLRYFMPHLKLNFLKLMKPLLIEITLNYHARLLF